jgi:NodT family efflux transporter outer membrane factor (OMF) lipoprotein
MSSRQCFCALLAVLCVEGCATPVPQVLRAKDIPDAFSSSTTTTDVWPSSDWWRGFGNPELAAFIAESQANNLDLAAATARIRAADALVTIQRSPLFPQIGLAATAQRGNAQVSGSSSLTPLSGSLPVQTGNTYGLSLGASYELDFWGLARSNLRAAQESAKSARYAQRVVALTVVSNVANTYLSILGLRQRIAIAHEYLSAINGILEIIKLKVSAGASSHLDLAQEQAQAESVASDVPNLELQERQALVTLAVLLGRLPEGFAVMGHDLNQIDAPAVTPGIPSALLSRRPDIAQAEADLASAHANLDAARAAFLPQIDLAASGGYAGAAVSTLLQGSNLVWQAGASLAQTVFDGGKLVGARQLARASQDQLIAAYKNAVLAAYADVESSLTGVASAQTREDHLIREVAAAQEAFQIARLQYQHGTTDLLTVLQAQQTLFTAEDLLAQAKLSQVQAAVNLYQALGGGWEEPPPEHTQSPVVASSE